MNVALRTAMTVEQFLAWEERQEQRYEFGGVQPVAMAGGTAEHSAIQRNLIIALGTRLRGHRCQVHGSELKIAVAGRIRYPEAFIVCTPIPHGATVVPDPVVVFEVLNPSTTNDGLLVKNAEYRATPSIQRYVILQQTHAGAVVFHRKSEDWATELLSGLDAVLNLPEVGLGIPLAELYLDVTLDAPEDAPA